MKPSTKIRASYLYSVLAGSFAIACVAAVLFAPGSDLNGILAADGYTVGTSPILGEYTIGSLVGQSPRIQPGWRTMQPWMGNSNNFRAEANSLSRAALLGHSGDGKGQYNPAREQLDLVRYVERSMDSLLLPDRFYFSVILYGGMDPPKLPTNFGHALIGFTKKEGFDRYNRTSLPNFRGFLIGIEINPKTNVKSIVLLTHGESREPKKQILLSDFENNTMFIVLRIDRNADGRRKNRITYWVDPQDISTEERAQETSFKAGKVIVDSMSDDFTLDQLVVMTQFWPRSFNWDEVRLSNSYEDLVQ